MLGLLGEKLGMTQVYDKDGNVHPVTVVKAGPCTVVQVKTTEADGYDAIQVGFGTPKPNRVSKPRRGHCEKKGVGLFTHLREFRVVGQPFAVGQKLTAAAFEGGDVVNVCGTSKGRGFQGVMKRHNKHGGPASHGSGTHRRPGSIGMCAWPGRVFKNMGMPGHMGVEKVTTKNLKVVEVRPDEDLIFIEGSVPGWRGGLVTIYNCQPDFAEREALKETTEEQPEAAEEAAPETSEQAEGASEAETTEEAKKE